MHTSQVKVIADSYSEHGNRIITFQLRYWRGIHAEARTHRRHSQSGEWVTPDIALMDDRALSRNAGSSRARPSKAIIEQVRNDPWGPLSWGRNQSGMQAGEELTGDALEEAKERWRWAAARAADAAERLMELGLHKQVVNRPLEMYTYIDTVLTATDLRNWYALRDHPDADPTIQDLARNMRAAQDASVPKLLRFNEWHLPYITDDDRIIAEGYLREQGHTTYNNLAILDLLKKISAARCARVSYRAFDGTVSPIEKDLALYHDLVVETPLHASPAEHQATPDEKMMDGNWMSPELHGNLTGWIQYRKTLPNEFVS